MNKAKAYPQRVTPLPCLLMFLTLRDVRYLAGWGQTLYLIFAGASVAKKGKFYKTEAVFTTIYILHNL